MFSVLLPVLAERKLGFSIAPDEAFISACKLASVLVKHEKSNAVALFEACAASWRFLTTSEDPMARRETLCLTEDVLLNLPLAQSADFVHGLELCLHEMAAQEDDYEVCIIICRLLLVLFRLRGSPSNYPGSGILRSLVRILFSRSERMILTPPPV